MKKRTKKLIFYVVGLAFAATTIAFVATSGESNPESIVYSASALSAIESDFDFGTISMKDGDVSYGFEVKNNGSESVTIKKVYTSCMCTAAYITDGSGEKYGKFGMPGHGVIPNTGIKIGPGELALVEAIFDPAAHGPSGVGLAERSVYIESNSAKSPKLELKFRALVIR